MKISLSYGHEYEVFLLAESRAFIKEKKKRGHKDKINIRNS